MSNLKFIVKIPDKTIGLHLNIILIFFYLMIGHGVWNWPKASIHHLILILYSMFKDNPANGQFLSWRKTGKLMFITISNPSERVCRVCYFPNINLSWFWIWLCAFIEFHSLPDPFTQQYQMFSVRAYRFSTLCWWLTMANFKRRLLSP